MRQNVEQVARQLAAKAMGLVDDPNGEHLPDDLWRQKFDQARVISDIDEAKRRLDGHVWPDSISRLERIIERMLNGELLK